MHTVMGIDQSMTCTAIATLDHMGSVGSSSADVTYVDEYVVVQTKKEHDDWVKDTMVRSIHIAQAILEQIVKQQPEFVCIEAPSLGSKGNATRTLPMLFATIITTIAPYLRTHNVKLITVPPTSLKKFATGSGNANKQAMLLAIEPVDKKYFDDISKVPISKGKYDLADSFWLARWVIEHKDKDSD